jgi:hypothetical protein
MRCYTPAFGAAWTLAARVSELAKGAAKHIWCTGQQARNAQPHVASLNPFNKLLGAVRGQRWQVLALSDCRPLVCSPFRLSACTQPHPHMGG